MHLPTCDGCHQQIRSEYVRIYSIHAVLCRQCFDQRRVCRPDPGAVGEAIAEEAFAKATGWYQR